MVDGIWLKSGLVGLFGGRIMLNKFQGKWDPLSCTCFTMPPCCTRILGIYCGSLAKQMVVEFSVDQLHDHMSLHKKFHQQWIKEIVTPFTKLHSSGKVHLGHAMFSEKLARYD